MKNIHCPYKWDCGKEFKTSKLNEHDLEFIRSATEKKMTFMFICCPQCSRKFSFNTVTWEAKASHAQEPLENTSLKKVKTKKELRAILKKEKTEIPLPYFEFLTSKKFNVKVPVFKGEDDFSLYTLNELCEEISIDGQRIIRANQLSIYSNSILEVNDADFNAKNKNEYLELSNCLAIGHENTRILYINPKDNNTLHVFHPDGGDSEKVRGLRISDLIKE